jgi:hypothetical protein
VPADAGGTAGRIATRSFGVPTPELAIVGIAIVGVLIGSAIAVDLFALATARTLSRNQSAAAVK